MKAMLASLGLGLGVAAAGPRTEVVEVMELGRVPAGFPVGFALLTTEDRQFVGFYDEDRRMTIRMRELGSPKWETKVLPSRIEWDSHNYITMAVDQTGHLHVTGNMHADPLIYFRASQPGDIQSLEKLAMTGEEENRVTYPEFIEDAEGRLLFHYRHGGSGRGIHLCNRYDPVARRWERLHEAPMFDGEGRVSAYPMGPMKGRDGWFHMVWVWRDTPDCATNHHLSYARSRDFVQWESAFGEKVDLPLTLSEESLWVDPIPSGGGIINGGYRFLIDGQDRPVIAYHKRDESGAMQLYVARAGDGSWERRCLTEWDDPVPFSGRGAMGFIGIRLGEFAQMGPGRLVLPYRHRREGRGQLWIDEATLQTVESAGPLPPPFPAEMEIVTSDFPGMGIKRAEDLGQAPEPGIQYLLQWETLPANQDRPRRPPLPSPSALRLYKLRQR